VNDVDALSAVIRDNGINFWFDVNRDGDLTLDDHTSWVKDIKGTWIGDANLDGEFNSSDLVGVFQAGKFETGADASWAEGDWNADGVFGSGDLVAAFQGGGYRQGPLMAVASVPEPTSTAMLLCASAGLVFLRRWWSST
jgi:hypothetical protein